MARAHSSSFQEDFLAELPDDDLDGLAMLHAASWPPAVLSPTWRRRPEPPAAPRRKPSNAAWEVPFLALPSAPPGKKRSLTASTACSQSGSAGTLPSSSDLPAPFLEEAEAEEAEEEEMDGAGEAEEEDEACVFALDGGAYDGSPCDDEAEPAFQLQYQLVGLDDLDACDAGAVVGKTLSSLSGAGGKHLWPPGGALLEPGVASWGAKGLRSRSGSMSPVLGASPMLLSALEQVAAEADVCQRQRAGTL